MYFSSTEAKEELDRIVVAALAPLAGEAAPERVELAGEALAAGLRAFHRRLHALDPPPKQCPGPEASPDTAAAAPDSDGWSNKRGQAPEPARR